MTPTITIILDLNSARLVLAAVAAHGRLLGDPWYPRLYQRCGVRLADGPILDMERIRRVHLILKDALNQADMAPAEPAPSAPESLGAPETAISEELARTCSWLQCLADREQRTYLLIEPERKPISGFQERIHHAVPLDEASPEERARVLVEVHPQGR